MQERAQPGARDAVRLVAQSLHGLRPPVHVLLREGVRAAGRPAIRLAVRTLDPRQAQRRRSAARRARPAVLARRGRRRGRRDRPLPARRGPLSADARLHRGLRRRVEPVLADHTRSDDRPRPRRSRRGVPQRRGLGDVLGADARPGRLADDRARDRAAAPAASRAQQARARRGSRPVWAWRRSFPGCPTGPSNSRRS